MKKEITTNRQGFIFYHSFYKAIKTLPKENQLEVYNAIFEYSLNGIIQELDGISNTIFELILPQLKASFKNYENGKKGGAPRGNSNAKKQLKTTQKQPKNNPKTNNTNINNNNNINKEEEKKLYIEKLRKENPDYNDFGLADYQIEETEKEKGTWEL